MPRNCTSCEQPFDHIPFGPLRDEWCFECWFESLAALERVAQEAKLADELEAEMDSAESTANSIRYEFELQQAEVKRLRQLARNPADLLDEARAQRWCLASGKLLEVHRCS